jgi:ferric-dicitrate binding protein FerR (iron transport regulator)
MDHELLSKYLNETASPEERKQVMQWLADDRSDITVYHRLLDEAWGDFTTEEVMPAETDRQVLNSIKHNIRQKEIKMRWKGRVRTIVRSVGGIAACVAIVMLGSYIIRQSSRVKRTNVSSSLSPVWDTISNHTSHTKKIHMPDGTMIMLNPYSHITYNNEYNTSNRIVKLKGEAYFEVTENAAQPFSVHARGLVTHVLGTAFNAEAYDDEPVVRISLTQGKVRVDMYDSASGRQHEVLYPGHTLVWNLAERASTISPIAVRDFSGWGKGHMVFNNIPLNEVLQRVARKYNVKIRFDEVGVQISKKRVTSIFREETLKEVLHSLLFVHGLQYRMINDQTIMITR